MLFLLMNQHTFFIVDFFNSTNCCQPQRMQPVIAILQTKDKRYGHQNQKN